ncbi:uncharacterized protein B0P05DRAFT_545586 [Gilbertella persicaria]|uniref:uncharacterized protein n=1 Tax=Gilbertella persicaria TaxID=101096 RepID=UPI00222087B2|nr:uncharacterized protein B0P05DRAFT_545586 [Gilbertella persicaria]KAI8076725.1 hypothetical protein B0P05DRAFT_545586 [Gilbertella persicaria]
MKSFIVASSVLSLLSIASAIDHFPHPCQQTHIVGASETCDSIASDYGTTVSHIETWNEEFKDGFSCDTVKAGETICVKVRSAKRIKASSIDIDTTKIVFYFYC